jgi:threonyl-tRNA synthetase
MKVPYMVVIGDNEVESGVVAVRNRKGDPDELSGTMSIAEFTEKLTAEITEKRI